MNIFEWLGIKSLEDDVNDIINIDGYLVHIKKIDENEAEGVIINFPDDLPYFIVKKDNEWCGGKTKREAELNLKRKIFSKKTEEERIQEFVNQHNLNDSHTAEEWIEIHQTLTGSCFRGAYSFLQSQKIPLYQEYTTENFLKMVESAYCPELINKVRQRYYENQ